MRGAEHGSSIVRSAKNGLLSVSDECGRILALANATPTRAFTTLPATVPAQHHATLYQSWGDWFAWLDLACLAWLLVEGHRRGMSIGVRRRYAT